MTVKKFNNIFEIKIDLENKLQNKIIDINYFFDDTLSIGNETFPLSILIKTPVNSSVKNTQVNSPLVDSSVKNTQVNSSVNPLSSSSLVDSSVKSSQVNSSIPSPPLITILSTKEIYEILEFIPSLLINTIPTTRFCHIDKFDVIKEIKKHNIIYGLEKRRVDYENFMNELYDDGYQLDALLLTGLQELVFMKYHSDEIIPDRETIKQLLTKLTIVNNGGESTSVITDDESLIDIIEFLYKHGTTLPGDTVVINTNNYLKYRPNYNFIIRANINEQMKSIGHYIVYDGENTYPPEEHLAIVDNEVVMNWKTNVYEH